MNITTNHKPRRIIHESELSRREREQFDYLDWEAIDDGRDSASFFRYRRGLYDLGNFMRAPIDGWDGYAADSMFTGLVIKLVDDDSVIVGSYVS